MHHEMFQSLEVWTPHGYGEASFILDSCRDLEKMAVQGGRLILDIVTEASKNPNSI